MPDWLNADYESPAKEIALRFGEDGVVGIMDVLSEKGLAMLDDVSWKRKYEPLEYSYSVAEVSGKFEEEVQAFLGKLLGFPVVFDLLEARKFEQGDYTVLTDAMKPAEGIAFFLELSTLPEEGGGYSSFVSDGEQFRIVPIKNALFVVDQAGLKSFTKYVNHHAPNPRLVVFGVARVKNVI